MNDHLKDYVDRVVASAPPLTPAQADRIADLLRPSLPQQEPAPLTRIERLANGIIDG